MDIGIWNPRVGFATAGGTETFLREMCARLAQDHDITIYTGASDRPTPDELDDCTIVELPLVAKEDRLNRAVTRTTPILPAEIESLSMWLSAKRRGTFADIDHDVLSTHYYLDNLLVSRSVTVPTLFRFPGIQQPSVRWGTMFRFAQCDHYVSNSKSTAARLENWYDVTVDGTVYAGVDTEQFTADRDRSVSSESPLTILFVGRLDEGKGLYELIESLDLMDEQATLRLVGDGELREDLETFASEQGVSDRVTFTGAIPHERVNEEYAAADIFCLPSHHEGFPVVVMEALASGLPVVATDIDSIRETIVDGETGLLIPLKDPPALADALDRLTADPDLRETFSNRGPRIADQHDWEAQARALVSEYKAAARKRRTDGQ